jgi:hypothetical protein
MAPDTLNKEKEMVLIFIPKWIRGLREGMHKDIIITIIAFYFSFTFNS